jgi:hypothetical protein
VRALLAKAESTTYPEEADALTAKAQELMARHSIDRAMLDAFLLAYPVHIGRRLRAQNEATMASATAEHGVGVLPVLANRAAAAEEAASRAFPHLRRFGASASDGEGWRAGTAAAEQADLGVRTAIADRPVTPTR